MGAAPDYNMSQRPESHLPPAPGYNMSQRPEYGPNQLPVNAQSPAPQSPLLTLLQALAQSAPKQIAKKD